MANPKVYAELDVQMGVSFSRRWQAIKKLASRQDSSKPDGFGTFLAHGLQKAATETSNDLRKDIMTQTEKRTGKLIAATGPFKVKETSVSGDPAYTCAIFDGSRLSPNGRRQRQFGVKYSDILEFGHAPYVMSEAQRKGFFGRLRSGSLEGSRWAGETYNSQLASDLHRARRGSGGLAISRPMIHPGIKPYRFIQRAMLNYTTKLNSFMATSIQDYLNKTIPAMKAANQYADLSGTRRPWFGQVPPPGYVWQ
jgi:hypothetical protein